MVIKFRIKVKLFFSLEDKIIKTFFSLWRTSSQSHQVLVQDRLLCVMIIASQVTPVYQHKSNRNKSHAFNDIFLDIILNLRFSVIRYHSEQSIFSIVYGDMEKLSVNWLLSLLIRTPRKSVVGNRTCKCLELLDQKLNRSFQKWF